MGCKACQEAKECEDTAIHHTKGPQHETAIALLKFEARHLRECHCTCNKEQKNS